jgi:hypothetical protein
MDVAPLAVWYGKLPFAPPDSLVAVVAVVALPESAAVIVPAAKFPDPSRFTTALAVFALTALTQLGAIAPLLCNTCPDVPAASIEVVPLPVW